MKQHINTFKSLKIYFFSLLLFGISFSGYSQNLENIGVRKTLKKKPKVTGGFSVNQSLYLTDGPSRYNPYNYSIGGNIVFSAWGLSVPVTFNYNNQKFAYSAQQPSFNIVGASPTYKKWTAHIGYRNLTYSAYTLAGHAFLGGGLEYKSNSFSIATMGGRFLKAIQYDSANSFIKPSYERWGGAFKIGITKSSNELTFITFYAKDKINSLVPNIAIKDINPQENQVYSLAFKKNLSKNVTLQAEGALSGWTRDLTQPLAEGNSPTYQKAYFIPVHQSTLFYKAFKTNFNVNMKIFTWGLAFEYIEPEYKTLGAYFFNNDYQNVTLNASTKMFKDKVTLSGSIGKQRDDLNNTKMSQMKRTVGSLNAGIKISKKVNTNFAYSNFSGFTNVKPIDRNLLVNSQFQQIDTLNFVQVNQSMNGSLNYQILSNDNVTHALSSSANYQTASNKQGNDLKINTIMGGNVAFNSSLKKSGFTIGVNVNTNKNEYQQGDAIFIGAGLNAGLPLFEKKLRSSLSANLSNNYESGSLKARLFVVTNSYSMKMGKHNNLNLSFRYSGRAKLAEAKLASYNTSFNELFINLGYAFSF